MNVVDAIGWTLLHFLWQGALVGGIYAVLRARCRAPQTRYVLGLVALALCAAMPIVTLTWLWPAQISAPAFQRLPDRFVSVIGGAGRKPWNRLDIALPWLVGFWCVGIALLGTRSIREWLRLARARRHAVRVNAWSERIETLAQRFGVHRCVELLATAAVEAPTLLGVFKPAILLPTALLLRLPPAQLELILAHELCHVRRWDYLVNLSQVVLETLLFYHPAVHWLSSRVRADRELCCDQVVLATMKAPARSYAQALAELADVASHLAPAANGGVLVERIEILLAAPHERRAPGAWVPLLSTVALLLLAFGIKQVLRPASIDLPAPEATHVSRSVTAAPPLVATSRATKETSQPLVTSASRHAASTDGVPTRARPDAKIQKKSVQKKPEVSAPSANAYASAERTIVEAPADDSMRPLKVLPERLNVSTSDLAASPVAFAPAPVVYSSGPPAAQTDSAAPASTGQTDRLAQTGQPEAAAPRVTHFVAPAYPSGLNAAHGRVDLQFRIAADGSVQDIAVLAGGDRPQLARAAISALRQWRFAPESGQPGHIYLQTIDFDQAAGVESCRVTTGSHICRSDLGDAAAGVAVSTR